jgi:hypothetical protein
MANDFYDGWKISNKKSKLGKLKDAFDHSAKQYQLDRKKDKGNAGRGMPISSLIEFNE